MYDGPLYSIEAVGKDPILCTEKHPYYVIKKENAWCKRSGHKRNKCIPMKKSLCFKGYNTNATDCSLRPDYSWEEARNLKKGDYLLVPKIKKIKENFSKEQMFLFGFYAAEGCVSLNGWKTILNRVRFAATEEWLIKLVKEFFFKEYGKELRESKNELWICDKRIADLFIKNCGRYAESKRLSNSILHSSEECIKYFLSGYILGDGHVSKSKKQLGSAFFSTMSKNLINQIELLCAKIGIPIRNHLVYHNDPRPEKKSNYIHKGEISSQFLHNIPLYGRKKIYREIKKKQHKILNLDDYIAYPIERIRINKVKTKVYNLHVKTKNSYLINNVVVHNCLGTNIVGGYEGPYDVIIAPPEAEKMIELADMGLHMRYDWATWLGPYPLLNPRDVIIRQNNERYVVGPVTPQGSRGAIYQQHFSMSYIDQGDIRYSIPITGGESEVPAAYDPYREEAPTEASPAVNNKPEIPAERIIRGKTVTFENISY